MTELVSQLGKPPFQKSAVFLNIVQKAFDPLPLLFEHLSYFAGGVFWTWVELAMSFETDMKYM